MSGNGTAAAAGTYLGQTADVLAMRDSADMVAAGVSQQALFRRRGDIVLFADRLVLTAWCDEGDLVLRPEDIKSVRVEFTKLYGRFVGGLLNAGKPLILTVVDGEELYLLVDRKEFTETTDDRRWGALLEEWLRVVR